MFTFILNNLLLGVGLSMDAFSVSLANGFNEPKMRKIKVLGIAGVFGIFQGIMPMIGWICVHTIVEKFKVFEYFIPWIALILLLYIGVKMVFGYFKKGEEEEEAEKMSLHALLVQGIATSIDALSVGFTIAEYKLSLAITSALIIAIITFCICLVGVILGKKFGTKFSSKAELIGGIILICIGLEIFISGMISLYA